MRERLSACLGIFAVMALSNAIVPALPSYAETSSLQGAIYAAYFLGAFLMTLPSGLMSDRYGRAAVMQAGLVISIISGILLLLASDPVFIISVRFLEGIGAGLFVAAAMAYINSLQDHGRMSGYLMASLNIGLVLGLIIGGFLTTHSSRASAGIMLFTAICILSAALSFFSTDTAHNWPADKTGSDLLTLVSNYRWLWYSAIVLIGVTGIITSLYPEFSGVTPDQAGLWIASMSIATILAVIFVSHLKLDPVPTIRMAALFMAAGVIITYYSPVGFIVIGALAGIVMIAQMAYLAQATVHQGAAMGLFSTTGYLGMSLLPFLAGFIAETTTFFIAFFATACATVTVSLTIGRCTCHLPDRS